MDQSKFKVGKTYISRTNPKDAISRVTEAARQGTGGYICVSNMRMIQYSGETPEYNQLMKESLMNWPDGKPLAWCGWMWGLKDVVCTRGPSTFKKMMENGNKELKHFLFGDTQDVLDEILNKYQERSSIVATYSPPFVPLEEYDLDSIEKMIRNSGANIVWTAMTAPKQDYFNRLMSKRMPDVLFIGVGRAFRISIGKVKDAPNWAKKMGVGGMYIGRKSKPKLFWWYVKKTFVLLSYYVNIIWRRISGQKYYE